MSLAYLGLGSNLGDRAGNLARARELLEARGVRVRRASTVRETEPWGVTGQPRFLNQVIEVCWPRGPRALLRVAQAVEADVGRTPTYRWGPREIDIDLLLFDELVVSEPGLEVPHPGTWERDFVLVPLRELRPDLGVRPRS